MSALLYLVGAVLLLRSVRRAVSLRAAAILVLLPLCLTGRALVTGGMFAPLDLAYMSEPLRSMADPAGVGSVVNPQASDVYAQFVPWHDAVRAAIHRGEWPLWNPYELCGNVLAAAVQAAPYHPLHLASYLLPLPDGITFLATMTFFLAALTMFLFLRDLGTGELAALFGGAAWMLSTNMVSFIGTAHGESLAILPLLLLGARRIVREPGLRSTAILGGALTLLLLCGHPETALHEVALAAAYTLFELFAATGAQRKRAIVCGLVAGIAALLVCAIELLPLLEAIPQTREFVHREFIAPPPRVSEPEAMHILAGFVLPVIEGLPVEPARHTPERAHPWSGSAYAGTLLFAPALVALWRRRERDRWFFLGAMLFGLLIGAGEPLLTMLFERLPLFSIALNSRMMNFGSVGLVVLASLGVETITDRRSRTLALAFAAMAALLAGVIAALWSSMRAAMLTPELLQLMSWREVLPLALAAVTLYVGRARPREAAAVVFALLLVQRVGEIGRGQATVPRRAVYPPIAGLDRLPRSEDGEPYRIVAEGSVLPANLPTHYRLEDVRGYQAMTFFRLTETYGAWCTPQPVWENRVDDLTAPFLSAMNVRYALAEAGHTSVEGWRHLGSYPGYELLENTRVLPRAFVPARVHVGMWHPDVASDMRMRTDFSDLAWIESPEANEIRANGRGTVTTRARGGRLTIEADMQSDAWMVVTESAWKGWRARIDGKRRPHRFANNAFLGIHVPAGRHHIELEYAPKSFRNGAAISGLAMFAIAVVWIRTRRRAGVPARGGLGSPPS